MNIYNASDVDALNSDLELKDGQNITIDWTDNDGELPDSYFDGYADVYDVDVCVHDKNGKVIRRYSAAITHEALSYYCNGE